MSWSAYRGALEAREAELRAAEARLSVWAGREPLSPAVARLSAYRGIAELTALTLAAEVVDWHRFATARAFMGFTGLIPGEYSSGTRTRRGSITKAGPEGVRTALVEAAWSYRYRPAIGALLRRRQAIFCWVLHEQYILDNLIKALNLDGCATHCFSLVSTEQALVERLSRDVAAGKRSADITGRSVAAIPLYDELDTVKIDVSTISPADAARRIAEHLAGVQS